MFVRVKNKSISLIMKIVRIPHAEVEDHPENYNSSFHREDEAIGYGTRDRECFNLIYLKSRFADEFYD